MQSNNAQEMGPPAKVPIEEISKKNNTSASSSQAANGKPLNQQNYQFLSPLMAHPGAQSAKSRHSPAQDELNAFPALDGPQRAKVSFSNDTKRTENGNEVHHQVRRKVPLAPGHSPRDWARLKATTDVRGGIKTLGRYTISQIAQHNTESDMWIVLHGKVYNLTQYLPFHPGGVGQLMRVAGQDATELFMTVHPWVNYDVLIQECLVGYMIPG